MKKIVIVVKQAETATELSSLIKSLFPDCEIQTAFCIMENREKENFGRFMAPACKENEEQ